MTDLETMRDELERDRTALRHARAMARAEEQVMAYAARMGFRAPALAWRALAKDPEALDIDLDGDEGARNIAAPLSALASEFPELLIGPRR